MSAIVFYL